MIDLFNMFRRVSKKQLDWQLNGNHSRYYKIGFNSFDGFSFNSSNILESKFYDIAPKYDANLIDKALLSFSKLSWIISLRKGNISELVLDLMGKNNVILYNKNEFFHPIAACIPVKLDFYKLKRLETLELLDEVVSRTDASLLITSTNYDGQNILHETCLQNQFEKVKYLLSLGIDVNYKSYDGRTALHWVKDQKIAKLLLDNNAKSCLDYFNYTPQDFMRVRHLYKIADYVDHYFYTKNKKGQERNTKCTQLFF